MSRQPSPAAVAAVSRTQRLIDLIASGPDGREQAAYLLAEAYNVLTVEQNRMMLTLLLHGAWTRQQPMTNNEWGQFLVDDIPDLVTQMDVGDPSAVPSAQRIAAIDAAIKDQTMRYPPDNPLLTWSTHIDGLFTQMVTVPGDEQATLTATENQFENKFDRFTNTLQQQQRNNNNSFGAGSTTSSNIENRIDGLIGLTNGGGKKADGNDKNNNNNNNDKEKNPASRQPAGTNPNRTTEMGDPSHVFPPNAVLGQMTPEIIQAIAMVTVAVQQASGTNQGNKTNNNNSIISDSDIHRSNTATAINHLRREHVNPFIDGSSVIISEDTARGIMFFDEGQGPSFKTNIPAASDMMKLLKHLLLPPNLQSGGETSLFWTERFTYILRKLRLACQTAKGQFPVPVKCEPEEESRMHLMILCIGNLMQYACRNDMRYQTTVNGWDFVENTGLMNFATAYGIVVSGGSITHSAALLGPEVARTQAITRIKLELPDNCLLVKRVAAIVGKTAVATAASTTGIRQRVDDDDKKSNNNSNGNSNSNHHNGNNHNGNHGNKAKRNSHGSNHNGNNNNNNNNGNNQKRSNSNHHNSNGQKKTFNCPHCRMDNHTLAECSLAARGKPYQPRQNNNGGPSQPPSDTNGSNNNGAARRS